MKKKQHPIIILGMHRSGTTMLARMLKSLGMFIGWELNEEFEAQFFLQRNEKILNICGGSWHNPLYIDNFFSRKLITEKLIDCLKRDSSSIHSINFLGPQKFMKYRSLKNLNIPWGWKDPRNTFLIQYWLKIFPNAKILHIYRHGIDVANSLAIREEKNIKKTIHDKENLKTILNNQANQINEKGLSLYLLHKVRERINKLNPLYKYERYKIRPCISIEEGFKLWSVYVKHAFSVIEEVGQSAMSLKYEDFLLEPEDHLTQLVEFCNLKYDDVKIKQIAANVNKKRRFAFKHKADLVQLSYNLKTNYWLESLGYNLEL